MLYSDVSLYWLSAYIAPPPLHNLANKLSTPGVYTEHDAYAQYAIILFDTPYIPGCTTQPPVRSRDVFLAAWVL